MFRETAAAGERVRGINAKGAADRYSRKGIDELTAFIVEDFGAKGLAWFKVEEGGKLASPIAKNFSDDLLAKIAERMDAAPGDLLLIVADKFEVTCKALYALRKRLGRRAEALRSRPRCTSPGSSSSRCSPTTRRRMAGRRCTIRSPRRGRRTGRCWRPIPASAAPRPTTW